MTSHVVVISTDLRRATIKVSPGTYLSDVLDQACAKLSLDATKHLVKHKQRTVDLSVPFRTSGLVSGAKLELVLSSKTPSAIQIALQIPQPEAKEVPGGRLIKKFPSDLPIWQILRQFESGDASAGKNINITARGVAETVNGGNSGLGQLYYETPVLNIAGRELSSLADFQKTMSQLGHNSGSVLIRLSFKKTDQTLYDAMAQIGQYFKDEGERKSGESAAEAPPSIADQAPEPGTALEKERESPEEPEEADKENQPLPSEQPVPQSKYEPVGVFLAPSRSTPAAALTPVEENDYTPTIAHAQRHQQRLLESSRNKRLLSDKEIEEREAAEQAKLAAVRSVLVKVRFPDNTSSDWRIGPADTGAFLYAAVRHVMTSPDRPFHLILAGSKTLISDDDSPRHNLIRAYKFASRVLVSLVWEDDASTDTCRQAFLKSSVASRGQAVRVQDIPAAEEEEETGDDSAAPKPKLAKGDEGEKKVPKWFKFGKK